MMMRERKLLAGLRRLAERCRALAREIEDVLALLDWQDADRTYLPEERARDVRLDEETAPG